jgi:hypothetical protein
MQDADLGGTNEPKNFAPISNARQYEGFCNLTAEQTLPLAVLMAKRSGLRSRI